MIDRIAGSTSKPDELDLRRCIVRADGSQVLITVAINLTGTHDHMSSTTPNDVKHGAVWIVRLNYPLLSGDKRFVVGDEDRLPIRHDEIRFARRAGQSASDHRKSADWVGDDLPIPGEAVGYRRHADFGERYLTHDRPNLL